MIEPIPTGFAIHSKACTDGVSSSDMLASPGIPLDHPRASLRHLGWPLLLRYNEREDHEPQTSDS